MKHHNSRYHNEKSSANQPDIQTIPTPPQRNEQEITNSKNYNLTHSQDKPKPLLWRWGTCIQLVLAGFTLGTLIIIFFQLRATQEQTRILQAQHVNDTRAWVTVKGANLTQFREGQPITALIVFLNSGKSPALNVTIHNNIQLRDSPVPIPMPLTPANALALAPSIGVAAPQGEFGNSITSKGILIAQNIEDIWQNKKRLYVWGRIKYDDIFKQQRSTDYCLVNKVGTTNFDACPNNNSAN